MLSSAQRCGPAASTSLSCDAFAGSCRLLDPGFRRELAERQEGWRRTVSQAVNAGIPLMTLGGSLAYYDALRRDRLPANLTQAQRDYFGAHTYERIDKPGSFHTEWTAK